MTTKILRNIGIGLIFLIPFIPLYVDNSLFFPFITGKGFAFRILVEIIFALWLVLMLRDKRYAPRQSALIIAVTAFMVAVLASDLLGLNPLRSIWSNFERMEGWLTIVHLWGYFLAVSGIFGASSEGEVGVRKIWHSYFTTTLIASAIVAIYGFFQLAHLAEIHQGSSRIDASLGNAAYMAVYMLVNTFLAFYMGFVERTKKRMALSWIYIVYGFICAFLVYETATRGTILGLIGGIILALAIYSIFGKDETKKSRLISGGVIAFIVLVGILFYLNKDAKFIQNNETLRRMAQISISDTKTQARGYIWPMAVKGTFESSKTAIIGIGQENFNYIFNEKYDPNMWMHEQWFDRAHSVFLDWLVAGGLVGLILYCLLFVLALRILWKSDMVFIEKCIFAGLIVGYAVHNIFVFDNLISYICFFTILGFIHSYSAGKQYSWLMIKDTQTENSIVLRDYIWIPLVVIVVASVFYLVNVRTIQANKKLIIAMTYCASGTVPPQAQLYADALSYDQYTANQEIREQLISCSSNVLRNNVPMQVKSDFYNLAKQETIKQITITPKDARIYVLAGAFFNNVNDWATSVPLLEEAHRLSPAKQTITFELTTAYVNIGKEKEALTLLEKAYNDSPNNDTAQAAYVTGLILNGQEKKARELFADKPDLFTDGRILNAYAKLKQYDKMIAIYKTLLAKDPKNIQMNASLVATYLANGEMSAAIAELEAMITRFPEVKSQLETAIKEIRSGKNPLKQK